MRGFNSLQECYQTLETAQYACIQLGLERMLAALKYLRIDPTQLARKGCVTVAGTNGKGTSVFLLSRLLQEAGYKVGSYFSPHLFHFNERMQLNGIPIDDDELLAAFNACYECLEKFKLTYFEYVTLTALNWYAKRKIDYLILEVGLGGRLDAVNVASPILTMITNVEFDHMQWLGETIEAIAGEKSGIMRPAVPCIFASKACPEAILKKSRELESPLYRPQDAYDWQRLDGDCYELRYHGKALGVFEPGSHPLEQVASVLMGYQLLEGALPKCDLSNFFKSQLLNGRCQLVERQGRRYLLDVAHNEASVARLAEKLVEIHHAGKVFAVFSMLSDKDLRRCVELMLPLVDQWFIGPIEDKRGVPLQSLSRVLRDAGASFEGAANLKEAFCHAQASASSEDLVVVFGSFRVLGELGEYFE